MFPAEARATRNHALRMHGVNFPILSFEPHYKAEYGNSLLVNGKLSDLTIVCDHFTFRAHQDFLSTHSKFFHAQIDGHPEGWQKHKTVEVPLNKVDPLAVAMLLLITYCGDTRQHLDNVVETFPKLTSTPLSGSQVCEAAAAQLDEPHPILLSLLIPGGLPNEWPDENFEPSKSLKKVDVTRYTSHPPFFRIKPRLINEWLLLELETTIKVYELATRLQFDDIAPAVADYIVSWFTSFGLISLAQCAPGIDYRYSETVLRLIYTHTDPNDAKLRGAITRACVQHRKVVQFIPGAMDAIIEHDQEGWDLLVDLSKELENNAARGPRRVEPLEAIWAEYRRGTSLGRKLMERLREEQAKGVTSLSWPLV